jgi:hypothetical protein
MPCIQYQFTLDKVLLFEYTLAVRVFSYVKYSRMYELCWMNKRIEQRHERANAGNMEDASS